MNFPTPCGWTDAIHMAANTATTYSITTLLANSAIKGKNLFIIFSADAPFWTNFQNATAAIPAANVTDGSAAEFSPNQVYIDTVRGITQLSFISAVACNIAIKVYEV